MWRRFGRVLFYVVVFTITVSCEIPSCAAVKNKKFTGSYLKDISMYQLGTYEFVMKLYGKNLAVLEPDFFDNTMQILINNSRIKSKAAMNLVTENIANSIPIITGLEVENLSDDQVSVIVRSNSPMKFESGQQNFDGFTFRIKILDDEKSLMGDAVFLPPVKKSYSLPRSSIPFRVDQRVTLELRDAELRDVIRMLMAQIQRNVIIDSSFPQNTLITMSLNSVRIDEVLNYFMRTYDITCYSAGENTLAFGLQDSLYKLSGEKVIKTFPIRYAEPEAAATMLKALAPLSDGEVTTDTRMRTLFVNSNPAKLEVVEDLLKKIDVPAKQVMIYASIFEFSDSATLDVQNTLDMAYDKWTFLSDPTTIGGLIGYTDTTYKNGRSYFDRYITASFSALETKNKGKTLANPSVIAVDGQEAKITLKQEILYSKGLDKEGHQEWDSEEVGPELTFTPKIENNGYVYLTISLKTGDYLGKDNDGNIRTTEREVETKVRVKDGMPFVIGGLFQDNNTKLKSKMPILGNIPLLGELFSYTSNNRDKSQAVMIITPYILESR